MLWRHLLKLTPVLTCDRKRCVVLGHAACVCLVDTAHGYLSTVTTLTLFFREVLLLGRGMYSTIDCLPPLTKPRTQPPLHRQR